MRWKVAILTASDRGSRGEREDTSAQVIRELIEEEINGEIIEYRVVPDEKDEIMAALIEMTDYFKVDLIITTGGTGPAPRDVTPEATLGVIDRQAPGFAEAMRMIAMQKNPRAMLSRAVSGIRGRTLIINLPGSPKGVSENLAAIMDQLPHALGILTGLEGMMAMKLDVMLREVKVEEAVGMALAHDLTQIIPGAFKGRLFTKGHIISEQDIPALLSIGKEHIYVIAKQDGWLHEDEAALRLANAAAGANVSLTEPHEGKVSLKSTIHGLAKINKPLVDAANRIDQVVMSTLKTNTVVKPGQVLTGTRVIPLLVEEEKVRQVEQLAVEPLVEVKPFRSLRVGLITTGSEIFKGRIQDKFGPVVRDKVAALGSEVIEQRITTDESDAIVNEIRYFLEEQKVDLILVTGGMSVDPDDRTPGAIKQAGARIVSYGTPMLPGSMLLIGYLGEAGVPVMGLPGCVMHDPYTSFDVLLPRICAGETIVREDITELGYGGLYH